MILRRDAILETRPSFRERWHERSGLREALGGFGCEARPPFKGPTDPRKPDTLARRVLLYERRKPCQYSLFGGEAQATRPACAAAGGTEQLPSKLELKPAKACIQHPFPDLPSFLPIKAKREHWTRYSPAAEARNGEEAQHLRRRRMASCCVCPLPALGMLLLLERSTRAVKSKASRMY